MGVWAADMAIESHSTSFRLLLLLTALASKAWRGGVRVKALSPAGREGACCRGCRECRGGCKGGRGEGVGEGTGMAAAAAAAAAAVVAAVVEALVAMPLLPLLAAVTSSSLSSSSGTMGGTYTLGMTMLGNSTTGLGGEGRRPVLLLLLPL